MKVVKVISTKVNSLGQLMTKLLKSGKSDVQEVKTLSVPGVDSNPIEDEIGLYETTDINGENFIIGFVIKNRKAGSGEVRLFSTDDKYQEKTYIWVKNDGTIEIGGNVDNAVRYSKLETAFNELKADFNDLVTKYNTHIHPTPSGPSSTTATTATQSTADITPAKIEEIKTL